MHFFKTEKKIEYFLLSLIIIHPWIFHVFQGLDVPEFGYWLVSYENFFSNPEVSETTFYSWLTTLFGAVVDFFVGNMGVVGFKAANVIIVYLILYFVYQLLIEFTNKHMLLYALLIAEVTVNTYHYINYYTLTTLFFIVSCYCLYIGLSRDRLFHLFIAGIIICLNIFIRFPNILGLGLLVVILYYNFGVGNLNFNQILKQTGTLLMGFFLAGAAVFMLMKMMAHYDLYINHISELLTINQDTVQYGTASMIKKNLFAQLNAIKMSGIIFIGFFFLLLLKNKFTKKDKTGFAVNVAVSLFSVYALIKVSKIEYTNYVVLFKAIIGFLIIVLAWIACTRCKKNTKFGLIALLSLMITEIIPFGSATVFHQAKFGVYLGVPVVLVFLFSLKTITLGPLFFEKDTIKKVGVQSGIILILYSLATIIIYHPNTLDVRPMIYTVDNPHLRLNFMSKERAKTITQLVDNIDKFSKDLSYILTYEKISTVSYLSKLKPYLNNTFPFFMTVGKLNEDLAYQQKNKPLPMVVRAKSVATQKGWPKYAKQINKTKGSKKHMEMRVIIEQFLYNNSYVSVWQNDDFEILIPNDKKAI